MLPTSRARKAWALRVSQVAVALLLLVSSASLKPSLLAQDSELTVLFKPSAGTFVDLETVSLSVRANAEIHYTLDGSLPTAASAVYRESLALDKSTRVRAVAIDAARHGPVSSETYLRVSADAQSFTSHLPVILIHTFESGMLDPRGDEHVAAALQVLEPKSSSRGIVGRAALDARIGIHVRGQSSRTFPKKQYAIELRGDADEADTARPMLGMPSHADWVLSDPVVYDRSLIRNALAYALSNRIGRYAPRTRFAEVFMVDDNGDVGARSFLGFYTLIEKIDRDADRVNVARLPESASSLPAISGGFIVSVDKGTPDFVGGGRWLQFVYPNTEDMALPARKPQLDFIRGYIDDFEQAARATNFKHPATGQHYSEIIDVGAWIDHHIINVLAKNVDGLRYSTYFHKDRNGLLAAGPVWDFDRSFGTVYDQRATEPAEWSTGWGNAAGYFNDGWWRLLFRDPDFVSRYRARFTALLNSEFSADNLDRIVDRLASEVGDAADRNFGRWRQTPPLDNSHAAEIAVLKDFLRRRAAWIKVQLDTNF